MSAVAGLVLVGLATMLAGCDNSYQTGADWFHNCWNALHSKDGKPATPEEAIAWAKCAPTAERALYDAGYIIAGSPEYAVTPQLQAIGRACPSSWSDIPLFGVQELAVNLIEKAGGPAPKYRTLPADGMIVDVFKSEWPNCPDVRKANGFPKIVRKGEGWGWARECEPCKDEERARQRQ